MAVRPQRTATTRVVTEINRTALLDCLEHNGPLSRKQLAVRTGLSPATVERITTALMSEGILVVDGQERSSGGRPSWLLRIAVETRVVAAIEVSASGARGLLRDLSPVTLVEETIEFENAYGATATARLEGTLALARRLAERATARGTSLLGLGVAVPGIVHEAKVMNTVDLGWNEVPLQSILEQEIGVPVIVENDANAIAFGAWARGAVAGTQSIACYVLDVGVGAGIVTGGEIHRGARSAAGEIGFLLTGTEALQRYFTDQGDLESRIAEVGSRYRSASGGPSQEAMRRLLDDAAAKNPEAKAAADELFDLIAFSIGALAAVLDPAVIILAGHLAQHPDHARAEITSRLTGRIPSVPELTVDSLGKDGPLAGVAEMIARRVKSATYLA